MGSIRLKCWENLTAGLTGWLYLRGSCAPADCAWLDWEGAESSTPSPNLVPLSAQYRTTQRRTPLVPYPAHDPPVSLPYASDSARSPEGKSGTCQGRRCIETATYLTYSSHSSNALHVEALTCTRLDVFHSTVCAVGRRAHLSFKRIRSVAAAGPESLCDPL